MPKHFHSERPLLDARNLVVNFEKQQIPRAQKRATRNDNIGFPNLYRLSINCYTTKMHARTYRKNSPRQISSASPSNSRRLRSQRTVCTPPGARTSTGDSAMPASIAAIAEAQEPVPEDCVSPAPRS